MIAKPRSWDDSSSELLTLDAIRQLHTPSSHYRVSAFRYDAGVAFSGKHIAGRLYVLSGACRMFFGELRVIVEAGEFFDFPAGDYRFEVFGDEAVHLVNVWRLPEQFCAKDDD